MNIFFVEAKLTRTLYNICGDTLVDCIDGEISRQVASDLDLAVAPPQRLKKP
jgi:hypothetical protein